MTREPVLEELDRAMPTDGGSSRTIWLDERGAWRTKLRGRAVLADPRINKGTAFTLEEREALGLIGTLPSRVLSLDQQVQRVCQQLDSLPTPFAKHLFLADLRHRNQVLFYRLVWDRLRELLPVIYTPTVGEAISTYSHYFRRPRGVYLCAEQPEAIERSLQAAVNDDRAVDLLIATDAEAILGIGDWGVGGMGIATGKLALYTIAAGIDPNRAIPVILDVGTNNQALLEDPLYLGLQRPRIAADDYDRFIDAYVQAASRVFPGALLHWEDFGATNARRILDRYRNRLPTFNDDVQGTGAINLAAVLAAVKVTQVPLHEHRIAIFGAGTAGIGIADQLRDALVLEGLGRAEAARRIWCVDRHGLIFDGIATTSGGQRSYARPADEVQDWRRDPAGRIDLAEVVRRARPTVLIGASTVAGAFTEDIVREMADGVARPVILPLSNPTDRAEATPADLVRWTDGRALIATGSPFEPVSHDGQTYQIGQANNALIFPGLGLGAIAAGASRVTDTMVLAAAHAVADLADASRPGTSLLPPIERLRETSRAVAVAVCRAAERDGVADISLNGDAANRLEQLAWEPTYRPVLAA